MSGTPCHAAFLGIVEYSQALNLQLQICEMKRRGIGEDVLLLLEHPPTITLGRNGKWRHLRVSDDVLRCLGVQRLEVDRGGDITFHGPGQLVGYPLLKLKTQERDVHRYMRNLEEVLIRVLAFYGIEAWREQGLTGVWTSAGKIAAMGVHITRWITRHGFALNVNTDLSFFDMITPCGVQGRRVTSMRALLQRNLSLSEVAKVLVNEFGPALGRDMVWASEEGLRDWLSCHAREIAVA